ncbi:PTS fructose transporter subunit IIA [Nitrosomonas sp. JL21]|uniref:PTS sugar transporter subunit IIA n=1 Tax=Nitrosomonas sp. JL21 TaxID=153949 RepID=UPI00136BDE8E|nr:PTS fructose transporter subunit IIA [Nitrosomonas sp. JL21]MBL8497724.1 PTS fructose transporter subunit IIA [Nitrosomonas sp.]MCC7092178.1 PTS fructose transporter subunit IIA [Nitrosomonas sp.]MXS78332.1 PTS fructose transporter subunit IIA [Nitrosomonas sp. JL21]
MIGILILTHEDLGEHMIRCASHVLGMNPPQLDCLSVFIQDTPETVLTKGRALIEQLDSGDGVLILSDMLGATPCNVASRLVQPGKVECIAGVNLPMLVRVLTYRHESLPVVVEKGLSGGQGGVMQIEAEPCHAN